MIVEADTGVSRPDQTATGLPTATIGIVTFNRREAVLRALRSCAGQDPPPHEIVVVDNASEDGTGLAIRESFPDVRYIRLPHNVGCPAARNVVYANSAGEIVVSVDDDGALGEGAIRRVIDAFASDPNIAIVAMRQCFPDEAESKTYGEEPLADVGSFSGGVSAIRTSVLDSVGGYPDDYFLFAEESHLALRVLDRGYRIVSEPRAIMWHPREGSSASTRNDFYRFRNSLLVVLQLFPLRKLALFLPGRMVSYFMISLRRGSFGQYLRALGAVVLRLGHELRHRKPVSIETVDRHQSSRGVVAKAS